jgi:NAD(P)-dependent dehydrogenase (short-subunit alcohol dehydrogenase family)
VSFNHPPFTSEKLLAKVGGGQVNWSRAVTLVTGGASFIGSHLVEALLHRGASVRVVDNLSSGRAEYLHDLDVEFLEGGLHRTIDWYFETKDPADVAARFETVLTER